MAQRRKRKVRVPEKPQGKRRLARPTEAAAYAGLSWRTLLRLEALGKIKVYRPNGHLTFADLDSIDAYHESIAQSC
jgi:hypothetical protein